MEDTEGEEDHYVPDAFFEEERLAEHLEREECGCFDRGVGAIAFNPMEEDEERRDDTEEEGEEGDETFGGGGEFVVCGPS